MEACMTARKTTDTNGSLGTESAALREELERLAAAIERAAKSEGAEAMKAAGEAAREILARATTMVDGLTGKADMAKAMADGRAQRGTEDGSMLLTVVKTAALFAAAAAANAGRRFAATLAGYLVAGGLLAASLCFLTLAGYRALSQALGDVYASLIVGSLYLVAGLATLLILQIKRR
jgi:hypothetical protein